MALFTKCYQNPMAKLRQNAMNVSKSKKGVSKVQETLLFITKKKHPDKYLQLDKRIKGPNVDGEVKLQQPHILEHFPPLTTKEVNR